MNIMRRHNVAGLVLRSIGGGETVTYRRKDGTETPLTVFYRTKAAVRDPIGGKTQFQDVPHFRAEAWPWAGYRGQGDTIVQSDGTRWTVSRVTVSLSGLSMIHVSKAAAPPAA